MSRLRGTVFIVVLCSSCILKCYSHDHYHDHSSDSELSESQYDGYLSSSSEDYQPHKDHGGFLPHRDIIERPRLRDHIRNDIERIINDRRHGDRERSPLPPERPPPPRRNPPPRMPADFLRVVYMDEYCATERGGTDITVTDSIHVELTGNPDVEQRLDCLVTFEARDPQGRILLHFEHVDIDYNPGTIDRFRIYDGYESRQELTPARGLYGKYAKASYEFSSGNIHDYISSGRAITLFFIGTPSRAFRGFRVLLTSVRDSKSGTCDRHFTKCKRNGYCIMDTLLCNGAQNCGDKDFTDSEDCNNSGHSDHDRNPERHHVADIGLLVGCSLSIVILIVVVIWLGIICMKKKSLTGRYSRHNISETAGPPEGTVVEPAQIHRVISPPVSFMEPPPLYSENDTRHYGHMGNTEYSSGRFEMPPPYSPVDDRDTAGLIINESDQSHALDNGNHPDSEVDPTIGIRLPAPPEGTSSVPEANDNTSSETLMRSRLYRDSNPGGFRPLTGVTRQRSKDVGDDTTPVHKTVRSNDRDNQNHCQNVSANESRQSLRTQTHVVEHIPSDDTDSDIACQGDPRCSVNNSHGESFA